MTPSNKALVTRTRKLLAELADGPDSETRLDLLRRINAATLKLDRAGEPEVANTLSAGKGPAIEVGQAARARRLAAESARLREEHREALRTDPAAWMRH